MRGTNTSYRISANSRSPSVAQRHRWHRTRFRLAWAQAQEAMTNPHLGFYRMGSGVLNQFDNVVPRRRPMSVSDKYPWKLAHVIATLSGMAN